MSRIRKSLMLSGIVAASAGNLFQLGCGTLQNVVGQLNPCGTILACDPALYEFVRADGRSPYCTIAPFCGPDVDPLFGGLLGNNP